MRFGGRFDAGNYPPTNFSEIIFSSIIYVRQHWKCEKWYEIVSD